MTTVKFTKNQPPYYQGDVATFEDGQAERYVEGGVAEPVQEEPIEPPAETRRKKQAPAE